MHGNKLIVWTGVLLLGLGLQGSASVLAEVAPDGQSGTSTARIGLYVDPEATIILRQVPDYEFEAQKLSSLGATYQAHEVKGALIVENPGVPVGWQVKVRASDFQTAAPTPQTLKGASLALGAGTVTPNNDLTRNPTSQAVTVNQADSVILSAEVNSGIGVFQLDHPLEQVQLTIPPGNLAGDYTAELTWTLESSPN